jgi:hypothetical protein
MEKRRRLRWWFQLISARSNSAKARKVYLSLKGRALSCGPPHPNPVSRGRLGIAELLRHGPVRSLETGPFVSFVEAGKCDQLAVVEPTALVIVESYSATADLLPKNSILLQKILGDLLLRLVDHPARAITTN